ncbi:MAG: protein-tyrosine phosphatase family protein [Pseudomonadota bacterium]
MPRYYRNSRLHIDTLGIPDVNGVLGLCACPGSAHLWGVDQPNDPRPVEQDLETLAGWGVTGLISLVERHELHLVNAPDLPELLKARGVWWRHLPIRDMAPPGKTFAELWAEAGPDIHRRLEDGERIAMHCLAGLGRTGTIAGKILAERGMRGRDAIEHIRSTRKGSIQTWRQAWYVKRQKARPAR